MPTPKREEAVFAEIDILSGWTAVCLSETWRRDPQEVWDHPDYGHRFIGAGGIHGRRGAGVILHKGIKKHCHATKCISEHVCYVDLQLATSLRLISVYFPDATYEDAAVAVVYKQIAEAVKQAKSKGYKVVAAGDWNAVVRQQVEGEPSSAVRRHGHGQRNARGQWLAN